MTDQTPATEELCPFCHKPFKGKSHKHGVRYLPRPAGPPPPPTPPYPIPIEAVAAAMADPLVGAMVDKMLARASLDVDVLARAIGRCSFEWDEVPLEGSSGIEGVSATFNTARFAANVAREYRAILAETER